MSKGKRPMYRLDGWIFTPSQTRGRKYDAYNSSGKLVAKFGATGYEHYKDKIGHYSNLDHNDPKRRRLFHARHSKAYKKGSPGWFAKKYLW